MSAAGNGCPCGGALSRLAHEVTTDKGASRWAGRRVTGPALVEQHVCSACGRQRVVLTRNGEVIARR